MARQSNFHGVLATVGKILAWGLAHGRLSSVYGVVCRAYSSHG